MQKRKSLRKIKHQKLGYSTWAFNGSFYRSDCNVGGEYREKHFQVPFNVILITSFVEVGIALEVLNHGYATRARIFREYVNWARSSRWPEVNWILKHLIPVVGLPDFISGPRLWRVGPSAPDNAVKLRLMLHLIRGVTVRTENRVPRKNHGSVRTENRRPKIRFVFFS